MIKKGDTVTIYEDPMTELVREGTAKIIESKPSATDGLCICLVRFNDDDPDSKHIRLVKY